MLSGSGEFSKANDDFTRFLDRDGSSDASRCFIARNFLLDEGVVPERTRSYAAAGAAANHASHEFWRVRHGDYLKRDVHVAVDGGFALLDPRDGIPETFRHPPRDGAFADADDGLHLVRLERLAPIATAAHDMPVHDLRRLMEEALGRPSGSAGRTDDLDAALQLWHGIRDARPMFVALFEDVADILVDETGAAKSGWADELRDRLGLLHLQPSARGGPIDVALFRYAVKQVHHLPKDLGRSGRPLVAPTVLDGSFSEAFCPAPAETQYGHTVDLGVHADPACRELLHPHLRLERKHLWSVGRIKRNYDDGRLPDARALHLLSIRDATSRPDYAAGTDGDLL
jgi:hypothetical protein